MVFRSTTRKAFAGRRRRRGRFAMRRPFRRTPARFNRTIMRRAPRAHGFLGPRRRMAVMPRTSFVRFKVCAPFTLTSGTAEQTAHAVVALDLIDPLVALSANQPIGFDQWMAFYENFSIMSGTVSIRVRNETATERVVGLMKDVSAAEFAASVTYAQWCQFPLLKTTFLGGENTSAGNQVARTKWLSITGNPKFLLRAVGTVSELVGNVSSSPGQRLFVHILCSNPSGSNLANDTLQLSGNIEMVIHAKLFNRQQLAIST